MSSPSPRAVATVARTAEVRHGLIALFCELCGSTSLSTFAVATFHFLNITVWLFSCGRSGGNPLSRLPRFESFSTPNRDVVSVASNDGFPGRIFDEWHYTFLSFLQTVELCKRNFQTDDAGRVTVRWLRVLHVTEKTKTNIFWQSVWFVSCCRLTIPSQCSFRAENGSSEWTASVSPSKPDPLSRPLRFRQISPKPTLVSLFPTLRCNVRRKGCGLVVTQPTGGHTRSRAAEKRGVSDLPSIGRSRRHNAPTLERPYRADATAPRSSRPDIIIVADVRRSGVIRG